MNAETKLSTAIPGNTYAVNNITPVLTIQLINMPFMMSPPIVLHSLVEWRTIARGRILLKVIDDYRKQSIHFRK